MFIQRTNFRWTVTNVLIAIYMVVYILQMIFGINKTIYMYGMNGPLVLEGHQYIRLITNEFMHGSLLHLLMNSMFIYQIGNIVERILGTGRYLFLVIVTIVFADIAVLINDMINYPGSLTIGASGLGYGLIGALVAFAIMYPESQYRQLIQGLMRNIIISSIVFILADASISWAGHLGGFIGGMIAVALLVLAKKNPIW